MNFVVFLSFSIIAGFLVAILAGKNNKRPEDIILAVWFSFGILHAITYYLYISGMSYRYTCFLGVDLPLVLVHGPFLYVYVRWMTKDFPRRKLTALIHFIPAAILYIYQIPFFVMDPVEKIRYFKSIESVPDNYSRIKVYAIFISGLFYILKSSHVFFRYKKLLKSDNSNHRDADPKWIQYSIAQMFLIWICMLFLDVTRTNFIHKIGFIVTGITAVFFIVYMAYYGITRANIYVASHHSQNDPSIAAKSERSYKRYEKSGLKSDTASEIEIRITDIMKKDKPYLKNEITLYEFARRIDVNPNHLSQVINERMNSTFWDLINSYRIEEFQSRIGEIKNKKETILSLAIACGFNSKSSFNTVFR
jgi:AraC-like DNA-binding protein